MNENGLQVILYMTLIAAMLLMIYKRENEIGFTTAKRRFMIQLEDMVLSMAIVFAGGDRYGKLSQISTISKMTKIKPMNKWNKYNIQTKTD